MSGLLMPEAGLAAGYLTVASFTIGTSYTSFASGPMTLFRVLLRMSMKCASMNSGKYAEGTCMVRVLFSSLTGSIGSNQVLKLLSGMLSLMISRQLSHASL